MPLVLLLLFGGGVVAAAAVARRRWDIDVGEEVAILTVQRRPARAGAQRLAPFEVKPRATAVGTPRRGVVDVGRLSGRYGVRRSATHIHRGIDISAKAGTPLRAVNRGVVYEVSPDGRRYGYGNTVLIQHPDGKLSYYTHLQRYVVTQGQKVQQGQLIGYVGSSQKRIRGGKIQPNPRPNMAPHTHMEVHTKIVPAPRTGRPIISENSPPRIDPTKYMAQVGSQPVTLRV